MLPNYRAVYDACYEYDQKRKTRGSLLLFWNVQLMYDAFLKYHID